VHELKRRRSDSELDDSFAMCPRYDKHELSDDQIEEIAERAAQKAIEKATQDFYAGVGKSIMGKVYWMVGLMIVGLFVWMNKNGWVKL